MKINIIYSLQWEFNRVDEHLKYRDWLKENNYANRMNAPGNLKYLEATDKEIKEQIKKEYNKEEYEKEKETIEKEIAPYLDKFKKYIEEIFKNEVPKEFNIVISKYGLGTYFEDRVEILFRNNRRNVVAHTFHELIHTILEKYINKYKIGHWEKERTVDLILNSEKGDLGFEYWQKEYFGVEKYVDELFKKYFFESKEKYFEELTKVNNQTSNPFID